MNRRSICFFSVVLFVFMAVGAVAYGGEKTVSVATLIDYAPFCIKVEGENFEMKQVVPPGKDVKGFKGYSWDVVRESFHESGYTIHITMIPWARAMNDVKEGYADILFPTGKNAERQKIFHYSAESVNEAKFLVYVREDDPIQWQGLESLKGRKIGVKRGFNYGDQWENVSGIEKYEITNIIQGFQMLDAKRIDGFLGYEFNWDYALKEAAWKTRYRKLPSFDSSAEYLVALKTNPKALEVLTAFDAGKRRLIESGKLKEIETRWFGSAE